MNLMTTIVVGRLIVALACGLAAAQLAIEGKEGWGWFLFASLILGCITGKTSDGKSEAT